METGSGSEADKPPVDNRFICVGVFHPSNKDNVQRLLESPSNAVSINELAATIPDTIISNFQPQDMYISADDEPHGLIVTDYSTDPPSQRLVRIPPASGMTFLNYTDEKTGNHMTWFVTLNSPEGEKLAEDIILGNKDAMSLSHDAMPQYDEKTGEIIDVEFKAQHIAALDSSVNPPGRKNCDILNIMPLYPERNTMLPRINDIIKDTMRNPDQLREENPRMFNLLEKLKISISKSVPDDEASTSLTQASEQQATKPPFFISRIPAELRNSLTSPQPDDTTATIATDAVDLNIPCTNILADFSFPLASSSPPPLSQPPSLIQVSASAQELSKVNNSNMATPAPTTTPAPAPATTPAPVADPAPAVAGGATVPATNAPAAGAEPAADAGAPVPQDMDIDQTISALDSDIKKLAGGLNWKDDPEFVNNFYNWEALKNDPTTKPLADMIEMKMMEVERGTLQYLKQQQQLTQLAKDLEEAQAKSAVASGTAELEAQNKQLQNNITKLGGTLNGMDLSAISNLIKEVYKVSPELGKELSRVQTVNVSAMNEALERGFKNGGGSAVPKRTIDSVYGQDGVPDGGNAGKSPANNSPFYRSRIPPAFVQRPGSGYQPPSTSAGSSTNNNNNVPPVNQGASTSSGAPASAGPAPRTGGGLSLFNMRERANRMRNLDPGFTLEYKPGGRAAGQQGVE